MNKFIAVYQGERIEVYADTIWQAKQNAVKILSVPKKKQGLLSIMVSVVDGKGVLHNTASV
jgi:hypothetical protein